MMRSELILAHDGSGLERFAEPILRQLHTVQLAGLSQDVEPLHASALGIVICIDLTNPHSIRAVRERYVEGKVQLPRIFVLPNSDRRTVVQAYSAGAHQFLVAPFSRLAAEQILAPLINRSVEWLWGKLSDAQQSALRVSLKLFEDTHTSVLRGEGLEPAAASRACSSIITAISHAGFPSLLEALRSHHNYTFRHSMYVTGSLVAFADVLGFRADDTSRAAMAGLLHDIGKIATPNAILNKPTRLDPAEWDIMRRHPVAGIDILGRNGDWPEDVLDAVHHHHEKLDGSGYADRLCGDAITDLTRMVSIADTFSALIDKRAYKPAMSGPAAFEIMRRAEGHLDPALVAAFETVALAVK